MDKKALIVTTVSGFVPQFEMNNVRLLQSMGYEVHYAANYNMPVYSDNNDRLDGSGIVRHQVDFVRSPFRIADNIRALRQLEALMKRERFELLHCHTPMGGALARLSAKKAHIAKVLYTAHGFHFFQGASLLNWLLYYPAERYLARYTDVLITINREDYKRANKFKLRKSGSVQYIPGVGLELFDNAMGDREKDKIRKGLGINPDDFMIASIGELSKRKNHSAAIKAMAHLKKAYPNAKYVICGTGARDKKLRLLAKKLGVDENIVFAGYRMDVRSVLLSSDCFVFPSRQEGLPVALMEAMAAGLPVVCSKIRGNVDLIKEGKGGYLIGGESAILYAEKIEALLADKELRKKMGLWNHRRMEGFKKDKVQEIMRKIYSS